MRNVRYGTVVAEKNEKVVAITFYPELCDDLKIHHYFLRIVNLID